MTDNQNNTNSDTSNARMQTLLAAFRQIGMPLLQTMAEVSSSGDAEKKPKDDPAQFNGLVESAVKLSRELAKEIGAEESDLDSSVRWALAGSASQVVAATFRATGAAVKDEDIEKLAAIAGQLQNKFKTQIPAGGESVPNTVATFRAKMMESMVPIIGAVAQYSFGRAEHDLLAEIAERLVKLSDQVTRALADSGATPEQWRYLCWNILRAAGQIYTECHYAEADRLLYMEPDKRAEYFAKHGQKLPMAQVWQAFNERMAMLATLATYLEVPASAQLDAEGW
ncbi:MAG: hypothetical protein AB7S81_09305 [Bdellovibrionales bacterium]